MMAAVVVAAPPAVAHTTETRPPEFVALRDVDPTIVQEMRYAGFHNFVGRPVRGYWEPACLLTRPAALALRRGCLPSRHLPVHFGPHVIAAIAHRSHRHSGNGIVTSAGRSGSMDATHRH